MAGGTSHDSTSKSTSGETSGGGEVAGTSGTLTLEVDGDATSEATDSFGKTIGAPNMSSGANQSFAVGAGPFPISPITIVDDGVNPVINRTDDIRIRIPAAFNMTWDATVTTVSLGGGAAGKVSASGVTYEDSNKTAVINVTSNFAGSDQVTIAGLKFMNFTAASSASNLQLVVAGAGGATAATDDKIISIVLPGTVTLSSAANQTFTVGQVSTAAITMTVSPLRTCAGCAITAPPEPAR